MKRTAVVLGQMEYPSPGMDEQENNHSTGNVLIRALLSATKEKNRGP